MAPKKAKGILTDVEVAEQQSPGGVRVAALLRNLILSLLGLIILIAATTVLTVRAEAKRVNQLAGYISPALESNRAALQSLTEAEGNKRRFLTSGAASHKNDYEAAVNEFDKQIALTESTLSSDAVLRKENSSWPLLLRAERRSANVWLVDSKVEINRYDNNLQVDNNSEQAQALFLSFRSDSVNLDTSIRIKRDKLLGDSKSAVSRQITFILGMTLISLLAAAWVGRRTIRTLTIPLGKLRSAVFQQRLGVTAARADEQLGAREVRMLAADFNALNSHNHKLTHDQSRALELHELARHIDRAMRDSGDIEQSMTKLTGLLGAGISADRVIVQIMEGPSRAAHQAQWARAGLTPAAWVPIGGMDRLRQIINQLWTTDKQLIVRQFSDTGHFTDSEVRRFQEETGLRSVLLVPIGLGDEAWGLLMVGDIDKVRDWTDAETTTTQRSAYCIARLVNAAAHDANQDDYINRLELLSRQKTAFLSTISHELRTPLTSIAGYVDLLEGGGAGQLNDRQRKMLAVVGRNSGRLQGLIEDLLVLNRIETGGLKVNRVLMDVVELSAFTAEELRPLADQARIALNITTPQEPVKVSGDPAHLQRAFVNVLSNAIKFSPKSSTIDFSLSVEDKSAVIRCTDHGIGVPAHEIDQLFSRFFRASNAQKKAIPGTGLGLAIVRQIIEDHHGSLKLDSQEQEGTTVTIRLPLA